ncbi:MAG: hypothetical protein IPO81_00545 [Kouleothrix sp.]|nr:hypothetical protein [Kouleothrix sp.]
MLTLMSPAGPARPDDVIQAEEHLNAIGITTTLAETLIQDATGRSFEPIQLSLDGDLMEQLTLLIRPEPLGGAEQQILENRQRIEAQVDQGLRRAAASAGQTPRTFLHSLRAAARARHTRLGHEFAEQDAAYARAQARLHKWQERAGRPAGGIGSTLWRWVVGGDDQLALPEAAALWNQREYIALRRAALLGALAIVAHAADTLGEMLGHLDERLAEARQARAALAADLARLGSSPAIYAPWTLPLQPQAVVDALLQQSDLDGLVAELLLRLAGPGAALAEQVRGLARQAAEQTITPLDLIDLVELEAAAAGLAAEDPIVPVGQALLDQVQRPTWQIARGARPRVETIQITSDGKPVYSLEGLGSAAYGAGELCIGFLQLQLGVAKEDLALLRDGDEAFQAALRLRNLYVLEDLALAWERAQHTDDAQPGNSTPAAGWPAYVNGEQPGALPG